MAYSKGFQRILQEGRIANKCDKNCFFRQVYPGGGNTCRIHGTNNEDIIGSGF
jgi:hypothetical protein